MIINHNIAALNTYRQLSNNQTIGQKSLEKLSSGLRINRAGDDAAGLAISEKMRAQIRGLDQASRNAQDGISMIQTAEGALNEVHSILQRMRELANQAANDTNVNVDRDEIQKEINQLTSEINRIGNTTEFNTQKLLNGGGVDPTTTSKVSENGLVVPSSLSGGDGATEQLASAKIEFVDMDAATDYDGTSFSVSIGDKEYTIEFSIEDLNSDGSNQGSGVQVSTDSNTISINMQYDSDTNGSGDFGMQYDSDTNGSGDFGGPTAADLAGALKTELDSIIASDDSLKGNYEIDVTGGAITISAVQLTQNDDGSIQGIGTAGKVSFDAGTLTVQEYNAANSENVGAIGTNAIAAIDFSNTSVDELAGTGISITNASGNTYTVDFYDSANGKYQGNAEFAIDLNGARTTEKIVERIVGTLAGTAGTAVNNEQYITAGAGVNYGTKGNAIAGVFITATEDGKGIQIMAETAGASGNDIKVFNNADVTVTEVYENARVDNEGVVSARALADGEHTVTITHVAPSAEITDSGDEGADISGVSVVSDSTLEAGTYRLVGTAAGEAKVQMMEADGNWADVTGYTVSGLADGAGTFTIGDLTFTKATGFTSNDFNDSSDYVVFTIDAAHYEATLTEAGSDSAGTAVRVNNGQQNVTLTAANGVGQAVVNIGAWDVDAFEIGDSISWSFATEMATTEETISSGQFTASFQIGANTAQSMTIEINDMRSEALRVSGTTAGAEVKAKNGAVAKYTQIESVSNGTTNNNIEFALDVSDHEKATAAISVINDAIEMVSAERSKLGAYQNRLEHTINNLGTSSENLTAAESRIRDVDMAKEMMEFTKMNILSQAAQAMLAQANQQPQGVLQLLR